MGHDKSPSLEGLHDSRKHRRTMIGGLRWLFFWLQYFGIIFLAELFTLGSVEWLCRVFDHVMKRCDLIGLISAVGTAGATKSLWYSALNDSSFYFTGHIGPGSLSVASSLIQATGIRWARVLSIAGIGNARRLTVLDCPQGLRYIGFKSNTDCPVANAVGASIIQKYQALWKDKVKNSGGSMEKQTNEKGKTQKNEEAKLGRAVGRNSKRELTLIILEVDRTEKKTQSEEKHSRSEAQTGQEEATASQNAEEIPALQTKVRSLQNEEESRVSLTAPRDACWLGWLPLMLTLGIVTRCFLSKQWFIGGVIMLGTFGMMLAVVGLRLCRFKYSKVETAKGAPDGDCLVVDESGGREIFHIIIGKEETIQVLFQRKIEFDVSAGKYWLLCAGLILYVYVALSVLLMPSVSTTGQFYYLVANVIGFLADAIKASVEGMEGSVDGMLGLATKAREQFGIVLKDYIVFRNRTAAVACAAGFADDRSMLKTKKLLPCEGAVWQTWWDKLPLFVGVVDEAAIANVDAGLGPKEQELLTALLSDMKAGLDEQKALRQAISLMKVKEGVNSSPSC